MNKTYKVIYSPKAIDDLKSVFSYISYELKARQTAKNLTERIRTKIRSLDNMPERYSKVDWGVWASMNTHKFSVDNYVIYYKVDNEQFIVTIIRIFYGGRDIESIVNSNIE